MEPICQVMFNDTIIKKAVLKWPEKIIKHSVNM